MTGHPLSSAQRRLWTSDQRPPQSPANNCWVAERLHGELDIRALRMALTEVLRRHDALRTRLIADADRPYQVVEPLAALPLDLIDLTEVPDREARLPAEIRRTGTEPFDLAVGPLLRACVIRMDSRQHVFVLVVHHMVTDTRSLRIINDDIETLYRAYRDRLPVQLPEPPPPAEPPPQRGNALSYWRSALAGLSRLELPTDRPHSPVASPECATVSAPLSGEDLARLARIGGDHCATRYMAALAVFLVLLTRHTGQHDIGVSTMVSHRPPGLSGETVGLFVDTTVLRVDVSPTSTFTELLHRVRDVVLDALDHPMPFVDLVEDLLPDRQPGRVPLAPVAFTVDEPEPAGPALDGLRIEQLGQEPGGPTFDLALALGGGDQPCVTVRYRTDLFDADTAERFVRHYRTLLRTVLTGPDRPLAEHSLLTSTELEQLAVPEDQPTPTVVPIDEAIAAMAERDGAAIAVLAGETTLTRAELLRAADGLAARLAAVGVKPGDRVGLTEEHGIAMVVGLLGALRAGAGVVPLETTASALAMRSRLRAVITGQDLVTFAGRSTVAALDATNPPLPSRPDRPTVALVHWVGDQHRAPRAVHLSHRALAGTCAELNRLAGTGPDDSTLVLSPPRFGTGLVQTLALLSKGGRLVLPNDDPAHWAELAAAHHITILIATSAQLARLVHAAQQPLPDVRAILVDDGLERQEPEELQRIAPNATVLRLFGVPDAAFYSMAATPDGPTEPLAGHHIVVLDETMRPVPTGLPGLLHIGGAGLAEDSPTPNPFVRWQGRRWLRTDRPVRWRRAGVLQPLPGGGGPRQARAADVETVLHGHPQVLAAATAMCVDEEDGERVLVGYLVPRQRGLLDLAGVRHLLEDRLPTNVIPERLEIVDTIPRAPDGTVDWLALPGAGQ